MAAGDTDAAEFSPGTVDGFYILRPERRVRVFRRLYYSEPAHPSSVSRRDNRIHGKESIREHRGDRYRLDIRDPHDHQHRHVDGNDAGDRCASSLLKLRRIESIDEHDYGGAVA